MVSDQRLKGKRPTVSGVEVGEKFLYKVKCNGNSRKTNPRWEYDNFKHHFDEPLLT